MYMGPTHPGRHVHFSLLQDRVYLILYFDHDLVQVGKDQKAQAFLATLDKDPVVGKMVDATSYYELEAEEYARKGITLTPDVWLVKVWRQPCKLIHARSSVNASCSDNASCCCCIRTV